MRKLFLAVAFVLMGTFAFANNATNVVSKEKNDVGICVYTITITLYYKNVPIATRSETHTKEADGPLECGQIARAHVQRLRKAN